jgi:hypothetical protein
MPLSCFKSAAMAAAALLLILSPAAVMADTTSDLLRERISSRLEESMEVSGPENCVNKCQKLFGTTAFSGQAQVRVRNHQTN